MLRLPFCPYCGRPVPEWAKFCKYCGGKLTENELPPRDSSYPQQLPPPPQPTIIRERIPDTSRLSGVGIQKFLGPGEKIIFRTRSRVWLGDQARYAYVTNKRLLFYYRIPKLMGLIKDDRVDEIFINQIRRLSLIEKGLIVKSIILHIDEFEIKGDRGDLLELYRAIQSVRGLS
ncbi:MAG: zinc-ribbon domain-containing protein [Thermoproteota archaeon]